MLWQVNLIAYLVSIVLFFQFNRQAVKHAKDNAAATIILQTIAMLSVLLLVPFFPISFPAKTSLYGLLIVASIFYAFNDRLQTPIRKNLEVSLFTIINQLVYVFLFFYGVLIFNEGFSIQKLLGVLMIVLANVVVLYKRGTFSLNRYVLMALAAAFALATAVSIDVGVSKDFNLPIYIAMTLFIPVLFIATTEKVKPSRVIQEYKSSNMKPYLIAGFFWALTIFFSLHAFQLGKVTTIVPLQSVSVILNVLVAYLFFKERDQIPKKVVAAIMVIIGVVLTVI